MGHTGSVTSATWLDATKLCTGSYDHSLRVWDMNVSVCESTIHCGRVVTNLSCQPSGSLVCTSHPDGVARLWDSRVSNGESVVATAHFKSHKGWISSVDWISSSHFVTAGYDGTLIVWDCRGKKPLHKIRHGDEDSKALCVLDRPNVLISGGSDKKFGFLLDNFQCVRFFLFLNIAADIFLDAFLYPRICPFNISRSCNREFRSDARFDCNTQIFHCLIKMIRKSIGA